MNNSLLQLNSDIKKEADEILFNKGLHQLLSSFGTPHVSGSYALDLMTWRDLDIYLEADEISQLDFFRLGSEICRILNPVKMSFRNEKIAQTKNLPDGLYWGVYLGNERAGAWKIDLWAVNAKECERLLNYCTAIQQQLSDETVLRIMEIKSQCWKDPAYRRSYTSSDIYHAVLHHHIKDIEEFRNYLLQKES